MTTAFNEEEIIEIKMKLREEAMRCASTFGMRKTTVEQLAKHANISKGAFYKFYPTKEHLFFDILKDWHTQVYDETVKVIEANKHLEDSEKAAKALITVIKMIQKGSLMDFFENDLPYIVRKMPKESLGEHFDSDDFHIENIIKSQNIKIKVPIEFIAATLRTLIFTTFHKNEIGDLYEEVIENMIYSVSRSFFE